MEIFDYVSHTGSLCVWKASHCWANITELIEAGSMSARSMVCHYSYSKAVFEVLSTLHNKTSFTCL